MNIIGKRYWFFLVSGILFLVGIISLAIFGLERGIEFSSGSLLTVGFEQKVNQDELDQSLVSLGYADALIQTTGEGDFLIRLPELDNEAKSKLQAGLMTWFGTMTVGEFDTVSPLVAAETTRNASIAVAVAAVGILLYLTYAFRRMPNPFRYGTCAVIALLHDIMLVVGLFSVLGAVLGWQINLMFVTGILAILGYSVNNIVIIFDRIRENLLHGKETDFETVVNNGVVETLGRSLITNLTMLFPIVALLLIVGASIQNLLVVLLAGVIIGTYDSICVAPALLVVWHKRE
ncbi:MAG: protein translocase subunit SecF [Dehalococcoidales bacterium]|jgi:preprotein translocase subunit SecF|nr:protein translocase subunit SecF [Dehalococcoidales bacterium]MDP6738230.1 protein translocase subunit SecF [Dehalococcoidales bacterium]